MTTFAAALLPRLFSGTRELERVPPACCDLRSANVSPHQPKPANPAGRETHPGQTLLGNDFKGSFHLTNGWGDCCRARHMIAATIFSASNYPKGPNDGAVILRSHDDFQDAPARNMTIALDGNWLWCFYHIHIYICFFTGNWPHGHTRNEIVVQKAESPFPWCLKTLHQDRQSLQNLGVRCWRTGWQQSSSSSLADSVPKQMPDLKFPLRAWSYMKSTSAPDPGGAGA